jgi:uncharacterized protein
VSLRSVWKWSVRGVLLLLLVFLLPWILLVTGITGKRVDDRAGLIPWLEQYRMENHLELMYDEAGVDVRLILMPAIDGASIEDFSVAQARKLGIGRDADRRSVLFVFDMKDRRLRVEVGPTLQGIFTDAFVGYLMRNHLQSFFAGGNAELGLRTTVFIMQARLRRAALGEEYDPRAVAFIEDARRLASGGGASSRMPAAGAPTGFENKETSSESRARFVPQPTPELAYLAYLDWLRLDRYQPNVPLFDPASQRYLAGFEITRGYAEYMLFMEYGRRYAVDQRGDLAMLYYTDDPLLSPHFFRRTPDGWQLDTYGELRNTRNYVGTTYSWGMDRSGDIYDITFADQILPVGRVLRLRRGDNRPLPTLHPW